jgi:hypothetical protein
MTVVQQSFFHNTDDILMLCRKLVELRFDLTHDFLDALLVQAHGVAGLPQVYRSRTCSLAALVVHAGYVLSAAEDGNIPGWLSSHPADRSQNAHHGSQSTNAFAIDEAQRRYGANRLYFSVSSPDQCGW